MKAHDDMPVPLLLLNLSMEVAILLMKVTFITVFSVFGIVYLMVRSK